MSILRSYLPTGICLGVCLSASRLLSAAEDISDEVQKHLAQGDLAAAKSHIDQILTAQPDHAQARFASGVVQVLQAVEKLAQEQYRYGAFGDLTRAVPVLRIPVPVNPNPEEVTYAQVRDVFAHFQQRLLTAESELAKVVLTAEVKLPLDLATIRLDLDGDGVARDEEVFLGVLGVVNRVNERQKQAFLVTFDNGDVPWLRGYCHFLCAFCDMVLAYDHQELFDACAQVIYPRHVPSEHHPMKLESDERNPEGYFLDVIAAIHLMKFPLKDAGRMRSAHGHFLEMIRTSRESWKLIAAETDDDHEWLPEPGQTGVLQVPVTREMVEGWHGVLDEMEDLLQGEKLVPFWRDYTRVMGPGVAIPNWGRGVNLNKFFLEPGDFDLVLTVQGTGVLPYLENGKLSHPETWDSLSRVFGGRFFGFAVWFN